MVIIQFNYLSLRNEKLEIMESIKIGRKEYEIKKGDYILYNGICYQFCAGDGRTLKLKGWDRYSNLVMSQALVKKINFDELQEGIYTGLGGTEYQKWDF